VPAPPTSIMGNDNGPACASCGRKIRRAQRLVAAEGGKTHLRCWWRDRRAIIGE